MKRHFNGVSLAGRWWPAFSGVWILSPLIKEKKNPSKLDPSGSVHVRTSMRYPRSLIFACIIRVLIIMEPRHHEKPWAFAYEKSVGQPVHTRSLIRAFAILVLKSTKTKLALCKSGAMPSYTQKCMCIHIWTDRNVSLSVLIASWWYFNVRQGLCC